MLPGKELLYPHSVTKKLERACSAPGWRELVQEVAPKTEGMVEVLAFSLMMMRLNGCMECETDSPASINGCEWCSKRSLRLLKEDPLELYRSALADVRAYVFGEIDHERLD